MKKLKKLFTAVSAATILGTFSIGTLNANIVSASGDYSALPNVVDNSISPCFPPIASQGELGACISFAQTYYQYSYEVNKLNNVTTESERVVYSPRWTNSLINDGSHLTANNINMVYGTLENFGCLKNEDFPYNENASSWPSGLESEKIEALKTRLTSVNTLSIPVSQNISSPSNLISNNFPLSAVKEKLYEGKVLTVSSEGWFNAAMVDGECIAYRCYDNDTNGHRLTIVGYDNYKSYDVNGNGTIESCEKGAFKVANSWGTEYNQCGLTSYADDNGKTEGYFWVMYDALNYTSTNNYNDWESSFTTTRSPAFAKGANIDSNNSFDYITVAHKDVNLVGEINVNIEKKYALDLYCSRTTSDVTTFSRANQISLLPYLGTNPNTTYNFNGVILFDFAELADPFSTYYSGYNWYVKLAGISFDSTGVNRARFRILDDNGNVISDYESDNHEQANRAIKYKTLNLIKGDINYDGTVTTADSSLLINYSSSFESLSNAQYYLADFNNDGVVTASDIMAINSYIMSSASTSELREINEINKQLKTYMIENDYNENEIIKVNELDEKIQKCMEG